MEKIDHPILTIFIQSLWSVLRAAGVGTDREGVLDICAALEVHMVKIVKK